MHQVIIVIAKYGPRHSYNIVGMLRQIPQKCRELSDCDGPRIPIPNTDALLDGKDEYLPVTNGIRSGTDEYRIDCSFRERIVDCDFDPDLLEQVHLDIDPPIRLLVPLLLATTHGVRNRNLEYLTSIQFLLDGIQLLRLYICDYQFHIFFSFGYMFVKIWKPL